MRREEDWEEEGAVTIVCDVGGEGSRDIIVIGGGGSGGVTML